MCAAAHTVRRGAVFRSETIICVIFTTNPKTRDKARALSVARSFSVCTSDAMPPAALVAYCAARAALLACLVCFSSFYSYGSYGSHSLYRSYSYGSYSYGSGIGCGSDNTLLTCDAGTVMLSTGCDESTCGNCRAAQPRSCRGVGAR